MTVTRSATTADSPSGIAFIDRQLTIAGEPFLILGGELHNSSSSVKERLDARWPQLKELGLNTVLAAVTWEMIEPEEGVFDFLSVDFLLEGAREHGFKLVPLWFASWKNGLSSYRPAWVKRDPERFPLARDRSGAPLQVLSVFASETRDADARAFAALMRHIREMDSDHKTVIMVQVQNEVGILGASRDHTQQAVDAYEAPVEQVFIDALSRNRETLRESISSALDSIVEANGKSWAEVFNDSLDTDELFQALGYARYIDQVAAAGRAEYEVPYFVNAWLDSADLTPEVSNFAPVGGQFPGNYPSGGPLPQVFPAWLFGTQNLTMLTPDIYWGDFADWCRLYSSANEAFFIPEMGKSAKDIAGIHVAIGSFGAIGTSPFGVDGIDDEYPREDKELLAGTYRALGNISGLILSGQRRNEIVGFHLTATRPEVTTQFGGYTLRIRRDMDSGNMPPLFPDAWGLVTTDGDGGFIGTGAGFMVAFESLTKGRMAALRYVHSGAFSDGAWHADQILNGDETVSGEFWRFPYLSGIPGASFGEAFPTVRILRCGVYEY